MVLSGRVVSVDFSVTIAYNRRKPNQELIVRKLKLAEVIGALFPGVQGQTPVITPMLGALADQTGIINSILSINPWQAAIYNAASNTTGFTATQSQIMGAETTVLNLTGTLGAGAALTLPTAAVMQATMTPQQAVVGSTTTLRVINSSGGAFSWTVTTATGWTLNGTMTVAQNTWRDFIVTITAVGATPTMTLQAIGTGTQS
jgi:hypothetical protein